MKPGTRALGVAESYRGPQRSTLAGVVVRASRVVEAFSFRSCTVGGSDATAAASAIVDDLVRQDVRYVLVAGVALAWYNLLDLRTLAERAARPVVAVSFEESAGLTDAIRREFDGEDADRRVAAYRALPDRVPVDVGEERVFVRSVGIDDGRAAEVVRAFTPAGGRPEPLRVAREAARAADDYARTTDA